MFQREVEIQMVKTGIALFFPVEFIIRQRLARFQFSFVRRIFANQRTVKFSQNCGIVETSTQKMLSFWGYWSLSRSALMLYRILCSSIHNEQCCADTYYSIPIIELKLDWKCSDISAPCDSKKFHIRRIS